MKNTEPRDSLDAWQMKQLASRLSPLFKQIIVQEKLPEALLSQFETIYLPLAAWIAQRHQQKPVVIGLNGAQGSGKSTLCKILHRLLEHGFASRVLHLSIDDLYLPRQRREQLAQEIHPLLKVRGVPGTHDVARGIEILSGLTQSPVELPVKIPVFDKASDDVLPEQQWRCIDEPVDIILFEGWCVGARAQQSADINSPINELEQIEDA